MKKYTEKEIEEINLLIKKLKKSSDIVIPNDFFRNLEIEHHNANFQSQFFF
jgi:hypothetical protein|nr:MAG TPA: hypothetical protein [Caudoviricetes sp.]